MNFSPAQAMLDYLPQPPYLAAVWRAIAMQPVASGIVATPVSADS